MVLFRPLSARERWLRRGFARGLGMALLAAACAAVWFLMPVAQRELAIAQCMEDRPRGKALGATRKSLRRACEASLRSP
ncbi:MAG TPA: hypothetical protein VJQ58_00590 [Burkholderiales bacterium]|jgi:hypothetical protein|nr:hypothetical protein [Burkholderiales bacterium]